MSNDENFREQVARLAARARESQVVDAQNEALRLNDEMVDLWQQASQADDAGLEGDAIWLAKEANAKAGGLQQALARLPQEPRFTGEELDWMGRRGDLVSHPTFQPLAAFYHEHITQRMGVPRFLPGVGPDGMSRSNPHYIELMQKALEPAGYEPPIASPDEFLQTLRETSKYGRDLTAREYNRNVGRLIEAKRRGQYSDR